MEELIPPDQQFARLLWDLQWTNEETAQRLDVSLRSVYNWLTGTHRVPTVVLKYLELLVERNKASI